MIEEKEFRPLAITFHPQPGLILLCDFSQGFREPEMVKSSRPVVVVSPSIPGRTGLVTVLPLSTVAPNPVMPYHHMIPKKSMPQIGKFQNTETWLKGDMIYAVGFHRLDLIRLGKRDPATGKRLYFKNRLGREQMREIYKCLLAGLGLGALGEHLP